MFIRLATGSRWIIFHIIITSKRTNCLYRPNVHVKRSRWWDIDRYWKSYMKVPTEQSFGPIICTKFALFWTKNLLQESGNFISKPPSFVRSQLKSRRNWNEYLIRNQAAAVEVVVEEPSKESQIRSNLFFGGFGSFCWRSNSNTWAWAKTQN